MPHKRTIVTITCARCGQTVERLVFNPTQPPKHCSLTCAYSTDRTGQRYGRLTVLRRAPHQGQYPAWHCRCDCGATIDVIGASLQSGNTTSCGCARQGMNATHGLRQTPEYEVWATMRQRCLNPNSTKYADYGGRGIAVCQEWGDFATFYRDMGPRPTPEHSIDRIDNDGNYEPSNCRWQVAIEQARNRRSNVSLTHNGETMTVAAWAEKIGVRSATLWARIKRGMPVEQALSRR